MDPRYFGGFRVQPDQHGSIELKLVPAISIRGTVSYNKAPPKRPSSLGIRIRGTDNLKLTGMVGNELIPVSIGTAGFVTEPAFALGWGRGTISAHVRRPDRIGGFPFANSAIPFASIMNR